MTAPLYEIPSSPIPPGGAAEWFSGAGGAQLRAALFRPAGQPVGSVVLSGGRTEPIEKYFEVVSDLTARGFVVLAHDWRGQGLSHRDLADRLPGHADGYDAFVRDYEALLAAFRSRLPKPWYALGHSMGGCLTLLALARGQAREFEGAILSAPMLGIRTGSVPKFMARAMAAWNVLLGRGGAYARPPGAAKETFETNVLTHDRQRWERTQAQVAAYPDLALAGPTWGWLDFAFRATGYLAQPGNLKSVVIPVVICSAELDKLVDNDAQRSVVANLPKGEFVNVPGAYHEILMETDTMRNIFLRALDALTGKTPEPAAQQPVAAPTPAPEAEAPPAPKPEPKAAAAPEPVAAKPSPTPETAAPAKPAAPKAKAPAKPKAVAKPAAKAAPTQKAAAQKAAAPKPAAPKPAAPKAAAAAPKTAQPKAAAKPAPAKAAAPKPTTTKAKPAAKTAAPKPAAKPVAEKAGAPKAKPASKPAAPKPAAKAAAKPAAAKKPAAKAAAKPKG